MAATEPPLTDEQLQLAYRQLRSPPWPQDWRQGMASSPVIDKLVRGLARTLARAPLCTPQLPRPGQVHQRPLPRPPGRTPAHAHAFDARRAAANDFDRD